MGGNAVFEDYNNKYKLCIDYEYNDTKLFLYEKEYYS